MPQLDQYRTPSPKAITLMRITSALTTFFFLVIPAAAAAFFARDTLGKAGIILVCAVVVLSALYTLLAPPIRFKRYRYLIAKDRIEIIEGLFFIRRTIVPIDRIYQIDIRKGPLDNAVGVAKVMVTTAGSSAAFRFLEPEAADEIALYINETVLNKIQEKGDRKDV
ncbi:MAG: PH domain-containing protein [Clostridia bacterium]|nr:PH domain-containing protein [Clostridia bacterium]